MKIFIKDLNKRQRDIICALNDKKISYDDVELGELVVVVMIDPQSQFNDVCFVFPCMVVGKYNVHGILYVLFPDGHVDECGVHYLWRFDEMFPCS